MHNTTLYTCTEIESHCLLIFGTITSRTDETVIAPQVCSPTSRIATVTEILTSSLYDKSVSVKVLACMDEKVKIKS